MSRSRGVEVKLVGRAFALLAVLGVVLAVGTQPAAAHHPEIAVLDVDCALNVDWRASSFNQDPDQPRGNHPRIVVEHRTDNGPWVQTAVGAFTSEQRSFGGSFTAPPGSSTVQMRATADPNFTWGNGEPGGQVAMTPTVSFPTDCGGTTTTSTSTTTTSTSTSTTTTTSSSTTSTTTTTTTPPPGEPSATVQCVGGNMVVTLDNPTGGDVTFTISGPEGDTHATVPAGGRETVTIPTDTVADIVVTVAGEVVGTGDNSACVQGSTVPPTTSTSTTNPGDDGSTTTTRDDGIGGTVPDGDDDDGDNRGTLPETGASPGTRSAGLTGLALLGLGLGLTLTGTFVGRQRYQPRHLKV